MNQNVIRAMARGIAAVDGDPDELVEIIGPQGVNRVPRWATCRTKAVAALNGYFANMLAVKPTGGVIAIALEREREIMEEGWTAEHDDGHAPGEMALAGAAYAVSVSEPWLSTVAQGSGLTPVVWPWSPDWWKPSTAKRNLERAGALIAAEWDRYDRAEARGEGGA